DGGEVNGGGCLTDPTLEVRDDDVHRQPSLLSDPHSHVLSPRTRNGRRNGRPSVAEGSSQYLLQSSAARRPYLSRAAGDSYPSRWVIQPLERLAPRGHAELSEQALHVRAHGVLRDEEPLRDLVGAQVAVEKQQHLELPGRQHAG